MGPMDKICGTHGGEEKFIECWLQDLKELGRLEHKKG
jgi:hypothetical protein